MKAYSPAALSDAVTKAIKRLLGDTRRVPQIYYWTYVGPSATTTGNTLVNMTGETGEPHNQLPTLGSSTSWTHGAVCMVVVTHGTAIVLGPVSGNRANLN